MTDHPFITVLSDLLADPQAAGIKIATDYDSPMPTIAPPSGTLRELDSKTKKMKDVQGEYDWPDGRKAVVIDSVGSQASRMENAAEDIAEQVGFPLVRFVDPNGTLITTSVRLSHRQADATWRAAVKELMAAGVPFSDIRTATTHDASALMAWFPTALLMGWWHSQVVKPTASAAEQDLKERAKMLGGDLEAAEALGRYATTSKDMRAARIMSARIDAIGVARRFHMPAKNDTLFGPMSPTSDGGKFTSMGLGSLAPVQESRAVVDVSFEEIRGAWWLSLSGLRHLGLGEHAENSRVLLAALGLLLHLHARQETHLRSGTDLVVRHSRIEVWRHGQAPQPLELPDHDTLAGIVADLGAQVGWHGPVEVTIPTGSILDRVLRVAAKEAATGE